MNIYANRISKTQAKQLTNCVIYVGSNQFNNKRIAVISYGRLNHNGEFQVFAANQGRWLYSVVNVTETSELNADSYYLCD